MSSQTQIDHCDSSWNLVTGCTRVSPACENCYVFGKYNWMKSRNIQRYADAPAVRYHRSLLTDPRGSGYGDRVMVVSMGDLLHEDVPDSFIEEVCLEIEHNFDKLFMIQTKRSERLLTWNERFPLPENLWLGVSVEDADHLYRIDHLKQVNTKNRYVAFEPLIGPVGDVDLDGIGWVIVAGEHGKNARSMKATWVEQIKTQSDNAGALFFFKQWDAQKKKKFGRMFQKKIWSQMPPIPFQNKVANVVTEIMETL